MRRFRGRNRPLTKDSYLAMTSAAVLIVASVSMATPALADDATAQKWIDSEFQPSTLSKADQLKELQWYEKAAAPFKGMEINVVSETITTHEYESKTLAKAFTEMYDACRYDLAIDYSKPPEVPFTAIQTAWVKQLLRKVGKKR